VIVLSKKPAISLKRGKIGARLLLVTNFWKCWNSIQSKSNHITQIDGLTDEAKIAKHFAHHFEQVCSPFNEALNHDLSEQYKAARTAYNGSNLRVTEPFDVNLLSTIVLDMKNGKAAGLDRLTAEDIKNSHPVIFSILCKLFNQFLLLGWIPPAFGISYTVPVPKCDGRTQTMSATNFRGTSINPVISKLFEMAILHRFADYFSTSDDLSLAL